MKHALLSIVTTCLAFSCFAQEFAYPDQPFVEELLAQERGKWDFQGALGHRLKHPGTVILKARGTSTPTQLAILLEDPEFPGDRNHAEWKTINPENDGCTFVVNEPNAKLTILAEKPDNDGIVNAIASKIDLNEAMAGTHNLAAIFMKIDNQWTPLELPGQSGSLKVTTTQLASLFDESEPVVLKAYGWPKLPGSGTIYIEDYWNKKTVFTQTVKLGGPSASIAIPLNQFGSFTATLTCGDINAKLRFARIPKRKDIDPENSFMGMNIFQQQTWYHSYQLPIFAKAGFRWIRPWLAWENVWSKQETTKGNLNLKYLDTQLRRLKLHGQALEYMFYRFPAWLVGKNASNDRVALDENQLQEWEKHVEAIVKHCSPQVLDYEIWNEPDICANGSFSAEFYATLAIRGYAAAKRANPNARVHTLSHAGSLDWLKAAGNRNVAKATDVVTLHRYSGIENFNFHESKRQLILDQCGFFGIPQYFNEIGRGGYDESPEYAANHKGTTEHDQARTLVANAAQALAIAGPNSKFFVFCSLDPRDSAQKKGWAWDSAIGTLYLGLTPKLAIPAMAGFAKVFDGSECLGQVNPSGNLHYVAFQGNRAVAWQNQPYSMATLVQFGALPDETIEVKDIFANTIAKGKADTINLDMQHGPYYIIGSSQMQMVAATTQNKQRQDRKHKAIAESQIPLFSSITVNKNEQKSLAFTIPRGTKVDAKLLHDPQLVNLDFNIDNDKLNLLIQAGDKQGTPIAMVTFTLPDSALPKINRAIPIAIDCVSFIEDGFFTSGNLNEFSLAGPEIFDDKTSSMLIKAPFDSRTHLYCAPNYDPAKPLHFKVKIQGKLSPSARISFNFAFFNNGWVGTWAAAATDKLGHNSNKTFKDCVVKIPENIQSPTTITATLPPNLLKTDPAKTIFFIDAKGGEPNDYINISEFVMFQ